MLARRSTPLAAWELVSCSLFGAPQRWGIFISRLTGPPGVWRLQWAKARAALAGKEKKKKTPMPAALGMVLGYLEGFGSSIS